MIEYRVSPELSDEELNGLFAASWPAHRYTSFQPILSRSLLYVAALGSDSLVGFVNVAWDGGIHAFLLDTTVLPSYRRQGVGQRLVHFAAEAAKGKGIDWLHVDYEPYLEEFYRSCGFRPTAAGVMRLTEGEG